MRRDDLYSRKWFSPDFIEFRCTFQPPIASLLPIDLAALRMQIDRPQKAVRFGKGAREDPRRRRLLPSCSFTAASRCLPTMDSASG